jgi:small conductance mechanosensitive channel
MNGLWTTFQQWAEPYIGRVIGAAVILLVGMVILKLVIAPLRRLLQRGRMESSGASFFANTARGLILAVVVIGVLGQLGVETTSLLAILAAAGLAIALSLQNMLSNFTAGLLLLAFRMVRVGDVIDVGGFRGRVSDLFPFHVVLITEDNQSVTLPNTLLTSGGVRNFTALPLRRTQWLLPVKPDADLATAKSILLQRVQADPRVLRHPPPRVFVQEWAADRRVLAVQAWTSATDQVAVQEELLEPLGLALVPPHRPAEP